MINLDADLISNINRLREHDAMCKQDKHKLPERGEVPTLPEDIDSEWDEVFGSEVLVPVKEVDNAS